MIERKIVKRYSKPRPMLADLIKSAKVRDNSHSRFDRKEIPDNECTVTQRLMILFGPNCRAYARDQVPGYRMFTDIKAWKSFSVPAKMHICRERMIDEYLDKQREEFGQMFLSKYGIPFSFDIADIVHTLPLSVQK